MSGRDFVGSERSDIKRAILLREKNLLDDNRKDLAYMELLAGTAKNS